eukprot:COSAG02_NODE_9331_length_2253_cov_2.374652_1_plen_311_part_00
MRSLIELLALSARRRARGGAASAWRCSERGHGLGVPPVRCRAFGSVAGGRGGPPPVPPRPVPRKRAPLTANHNVVASSREGSGSGGPGGDGWNRVHLALFSGAWAFVSFAAWRHLTGQQVSRFESFHSTPAALEALGATPSAQEGERRAGTLRQTVIPPAGPAMTVANARAAPLGHVLQHAVRHATRSITNSHVGPLELRAAIIAVLEPVTDGEDLRQVLKELLPRGEAADHEENGEPAVAPESTRHSLVAALLFAERLCVIVSSLLCKGTTNSHLIVCNVPPQRGGRKDVAGHRHCTRAGRIRGRRRTR